MKGHESAVQRLLTDCIKNLGFEITNESMASNVYSSILKRNGHTFEMKYIVMQGKGIIHVIKDGNLKSIDFDLHDLFVNDEIDSSRAKLLFARLENGIFHQLSNSSSFVSPDFGQGSQFGIGDKDLDPLAASPGLLPP